MNPRKLLYTAFQIVAGFIILVDAAARPLYRPVLEWLWSLRAFEAMEKALAKLPREAILVLFAVPFIIAEPLKVVALLKIASGSLLSGISLLIFAHALTFLLVERIYHAGRPKLLS